MAPSRSAATARGAGAVAVGVLVMAVVAMLIVPLPTWLVDLLIAANLGASVTLLLGAAYAQSPLSIATFPTLLVLTTLFRLALNVSTVRLILLQADAGAVVRAFGAFVVRGDYVVGAAVFLILTIVQYVVIARGAERVAEVAARFTLDAMPGKQLAIDADLRARSIDPGEARRRRESLSREAQLYGALDGAMRFVKGDAVAAILILAISLGGGLAIGTLRQGMALGDAAQLYTLLTIGDGLASQIPALLIATAAGLLVTRVASEDEASSLGSEVVRQFLSRPRILLAVAGLLGLLAVLPGLPLLPFAASALGFTGLALGLLRRPPEGGGARGLPLSPRIAAPLELSLSPERAAGLPGLPAAIERALGALVEELGVAVPALSLREVPGATATLRLHGAVLPLGDEDRGRGGPEPLAAAIAAAVRRAAPAMVGVDETERLLEELSRRCPALCREVVPRRIGVAGLAEVLRLLLAEGVALPDLREVLEALAQGPAPADGGGREPAELCERVRRALSARISAKLAPAGQLRALVLEPMVEDAVREALRPRRALALEPALCDELIAAVGDGAAGAGALLVAGDLRAHLARLLGPGALPVVAYEELLPAVVVVEAGRVGAGAGGSGDAGSGPARLEPAVGG